MKKTLLTIAAVVCATLTLALTGCSKDPESLIIGTWDYDEVAITYTENGHTETTSGLEEGETADMTFREDGTFTTVYHSTDDDAEGSGTWSIKDNKLTTVDEMGAMTFNIDKLTKKALEISYTESGEFDGDVFSMSIVMKMSRK